MGILRAFVPAGLLVLGAHVLTSLPAYYEGAPDNCVAIERLFMRTELVRIRDEVGRPETEFGELGQILGEELGMAMVRRKIQNEVARTDLPKRLACWSIYSNRLTAWRPPPRPASKPSA
jgi:hypothetical protein